MALFKLNDDSLLVSLDIGSYSIRCAVFRKSEKFPLELLTFKEQVSFGLKDSKIINFEEFNLALSEVLESVEQVCKSSFSEVWLGFSPPFHSFCSQGMVALADREVSKKDVDLAIQTACAVPLPQDHIQLHGCPEFFRVDNQLEVLNPLGLSGLRLETKVCLITINKSYCYDIIKALKFLGYTPRFFCHNLVAFGYNLTNSIQKKNGVCFCDIGYTSTRVIVFFQGKIKEMFFLPLGGHHFTQAVASQFNISLETAEDLKKQKGGLLFNTYEEENSIEVPSESLYLSHKLFIDVLEKQAEKLLEAIKIRLISKNLIEKISEGFVFTGGTAYMPGFNKLASFYLGEKVSHPKKWYENFKQTNNLALIKQAYLEEELKINKKSFSLKWSSLRDLF